MKEKLNINKLIANHIIETGINDTCSFNYIVYLDSYLEEYDTDTQKYILDNKDNIHIEAQNADEILYRIIEECKLDFEKIIKYVRETNSKNVLDKLLVLAR